MENTAAAQAVTTARFGEHFARPLYAHYSFAQLPALLRTLFSDGTAPVAQELLGPLAGAYEHVILVLVDAFGWRFVEQYADSYPFLRRFFSDGVVTRTTAQFPSTTAAHLTTLHSGQEVGQHGVYEWFMYEPTLDTVIAPLLYSYAGDDERNALAGTSLTPERLYPGSSQYLELDRLGVRPFMFADAAYTPSAHSQVVCRGMRIVPVGTYADALRAAADQPRLAAGRTYAFVYIGEVDYAGHRHGCESAAFDQEVDTCLRALETLLHRELAHSARRTLLLFTADHGMLDVQPARTLALDWAMPEILDWLEPTRAGGRKVPAGGPRDFFLHIRAEYVDEAHQRLRERLAGMAEVWPVADLVAAGFFGSAPPSETLQRRVGNLVILPYAGESVWWWGGGRFRNKLTGHHGGLAPEEMHTQVLALAYP